jgi:hypothetical protein
MGDKTALVDALIGLRDFVGDPPRWGALVAVPAIAADPANTLLGDKVQVMASVQLPVAMPLTIRWGWWKPAPFSIPGLTLPLGGGGRFRPDTSTGGITHHDAFRLLVEWTMPGGVALRQWIGPNAPVSLTAQNLTCSLFRMRRTTLNVEVKLLVGLGHHDVTLAQKCVNSTKTVVAGIAAAPNWSQLVGSNWARRGGHVTTTLGAEKVWVSFNELNPTPATKEGYQLDEVGGFGVSGPTVAIPVDWCGPIWATTDGGADITVVEHWVQPPEMNPWAATP